VKLLHSKNKLKLFISSGEVSGDLYGSEIIKSLQDSYQNFNGIDELEIFAMGGQKIKATGVEIIQDSTEMGIIGIIDILKKLFFFINLEIRILKELINRRPDVAVLIDYPGFHMRLAAKIKKYLPDCKILKFVAPQVWAWNESRIHKLPDLFDRLLVILPFEEELHKKAGSHAVYIGNPSAWYMKDLKLAEDKNNLLSDLGLDPKKKIIGIFPGSRNREIDLMLPVFLESGKLLLEKKSEVQFVLVQANSIKLEKIKNILKKQKFPIDAIRIADSEYNQLVMKLSDILWLTSGTVTMEAACAGTPSILGYKELKLFWKFFEFIKKTKFIGLPNIVAQEEIFPELLQDNCIPENWAELTSLWLNNPDILKQKRNHVREKVFEQLQPKLNPFKNTANEIFMNYRVSKLSKESAEKIKEIARKNSQETKIIN